MMRFIKILSFLFIGIQAVSAINVIAQQSPKYYDYVRSDLDWYTIETEHFLINYHADSTSGSSRTARVVARIAEDIYPEITGLYQHEPDTKVSFILKDFEDYSNGAAYFFDNKIDIWAPSLDSPLRGDHNWLRNVITHEFTHIIQVQKTIKTSRKMPILYFQYLGYEEVRRPDVLYGYPNVIATYPVPMLNNPAWLAEGTAQFQRSGLHYDNWDSHRDMLLRTQVLAGKTFSLVEMGSFYSHTSLGRESVYNHGFAFTHYLANRFGEDVLRKISAALSNWTTFRIEAAIETATGIPGKTVFADFMAGLKDSYSTFESSDSFKGNKIIESEGFSNFYPRFSPDGNQLAYVSNSGEDFNLMSLHLVDLADGNQTEISAYHQEKTASYTCSLGHVLMPGIGGAVTWHPGGKKLVYAKIKDTKTGSRFLDLYEYNLESEEETRLTTDARASLPAFNPDGDKIVFVSQNDGSTNLKLFTYNNQDEGSIAAITNFNDGSQVSDPAWSPAGDWIYFGLQRQAGRDIYRIKSDGSDLQAVLATEFDERSPAIDQTGEWMTYSSDISGIYNLYRRRIDGAGSANALTNLIGGAFMPAVSSAGKIAYAEYQVDGYKIALIENESPPNLVVPTYQTPTILAKIQPESEANIWDNLNNFNDTDLTTITEFPSRRDTAYVDSLVVTEYKDQFSSFSVFPALRFDMYATRERGAIDAQIGRKLGLGESLLRNTKVGAYVASREILEGLGFFGGILIGPGSSPAEDIGDYLSPSSLLSLERDLFMIFDYKKGLPFIKGRWSPQISVELYNLRRNVKNGLAIEEFPCTSCYPETIFADIAYNIWEADFYLRSKVNRSLLLELGYRYSPYAVRTESFYSLEYGQSIGASSEEYYIGRATSLKAYYESYHPHRHDNVVPEGLRIEAGIERTNGKLLDRFDVEDGRLVPIYEEYLNNVVTLDVKGGLRLPGQIFGAPHGLGFRLHGSSVLGASVDDFFNDYVGGLIGARGYPFYALSGNETALLQVAWNVPLLPKINRQLGFLYADKLYLRLFADAAMAWSGEFPGGDGIRRDIGAELRLGVGSFYLFPTALFVSATYGLDTFEFQLDDGFLTPAGDNFVTYGNDLYWHFGVLFGFDL